MKKRNLEEKTLLIMGIGIALLVVFICYLLKIENNEGDFGTEKTGFIHYYEYGTTKPLSFKINNTGENDSLIVYSEWGRYLNGSIGDYIFGKEKEKGRIHVTIKYSDHAVYCKSLKKKTKINLEKNSSCIVIFEGVEYIIKEGSVFDPKMCFKEPRITKFKFDKKEMEISYIRSPQQGWIIKQK